MPIEGAIHLRSHSIPLSCTSHLEIIFVLLTNRQFLDSIYLEMGRSYLNRYTHDQGRRFLVDFGGPFSPHNFGLPLLRSLNTQCIFNWSQIRDFGHWNTPFCGYVDLWIILKTKWKVCWNEQLAQTVGLQGGSSKIIKETITYVRERRQFWKLWSSKPPEIR